MSAMPERAHGTNSEYTNYYCRCDKCRNASRIYRAGLRDQKRQAREQATVDLRTQEDILTEQIVEARWGETLTALKAIASGQAGATIRPELLQDIVREVSTNAQT